MILVSQNGKQNKTQAMTQLNEIKLFITDLSLKNCSHFSLKQLQSSPIFKYS